MNKRSQEAVDKEEKSDEVQESDTPDDEQQKQIAATLKRKTINFDEESEDEEPEEEVDDEDNEEDEEDEDEDNDDEDNDDEDDGGGKPPAKQMPQMPPLEIPTAPVPAPAAARTATANNGHDGTATNFNQPYNLSTLNPEPAIDPTITVAYKPPVLPVDMGPLQLFYENETLLKPGNRRAYLLLVAGVEFKCNLLICEPYASFQNESQKKKSGNKFKSLKMTKKMIGMEMKRRDPAVRPNSGNKNITQLMAELYAPHMDLTDERDKLYVRYMERTLRQEIVEQLGTLQEKPTSARPIYSDRMRFVLCLVLPVILLFGWIRL